MARQADSTLRTLRRMQADRDKALAAMHPAAMGRAGYWFHEVSVPAPAPRACAPPAACRLTSDFGPPEPHIVAGLLRTGAASHATPRNPANRDSDRDSSSMAPPMVNAAG